MATEPRHCPLPWPLLLLILSGGAVEVEDHSPAGPGGEAPCPAPPACSGSVQLGSVGEAGLGEDCIFFLETSDRRQLRPREACALESAVGNSGLRVVMLRAADSLDLEDNTTCHIYHRFRSSITFLHIDPEQFAADSPIQGFFQADGALAESEHRLVHTADALRLLVVERFGGFYSDTDVVFLRSVAGLHNVIASDQEVGERRTDRGELVVGDTVTNALFHFSKGAHILRMALRHFTEVYDSHSWASGGPDLLQRCLLLLCGFPPETGLRDVLMTRERFSREQCGGVQVLEPKSFYPVAWMQQSLLKEGRGRREWEEAFARSYAVHFFRTSSHDQQTIRRPRFYGARKPAYLALALDHCPVAYWSRDLF